MIYSEVNPLNRSERKRTTLKGRLATTMTSAGNLWARCCCCCCCCCRVGQAGPSRISFKPSIRLTGAIASWREQSPACAAPPIVVVLIWATGSVVGTARAIGSCGTRIRFARRSTMEMQPCQRPLGPTYTDALGEMIYSPNRTNYAISEKYPIS